MDSINGQKNANKRNNDKAIIKFQMQKMENQNVRGDAEIYTNCVYQKGFIDNSTNGK